jgi:hypothetical protein
MYLNFLWSNDIFMEDDLKYKITLLKYNEETHAKTLLIEYAKRISGYENVYFIDFPGSLTNRIKIYRKEDELIESFYKKMKEGKIHIVHPQKEPLHQSASILITQLLEGKMDLCGFHSLQTLFFRLKCLGTIYYDFLFKNIGKFREAEKDMFASIDVETLKTEKIPKAFELFDEVITVGENNNQKNRKKKKIKRAVL